MQSIFTVCTNTIQEQAGLSILVLVTLTERRLLSMDATMRCFDLGVDGLRQADGVDKEKVCLYIFTIFN